MKKIVLVIALLGIQVSYAQTWNEWFRQRKTQIEYLLKQIAVLQTHLEYLRKGYKVAKDGTDLIKDIKQGDFHLHKGYFTSLKEVSPAIQNYSKIAAILSFQADIVKLLRELNHYCGQSKELSSPEKTYLRSVYSHFTAVCEQDLDELFLVIFSRDLEMKSDERIKKVDRLYAGIKDKLLFARSFSNQVRFLVVQRKMEGADVRKLKKYWGK
jgi:hypothetical protein